MDDRDEAPYPEPQRRAATTAMVPYTGSPRLPAAGTTPAGDGSAATRASVGGGGASLLEICWRRRWTVLAALLLCVGGGAAYLATATRLYTSESRLFVELDAPRLLDGGGGPLSSADRAETYLSRQTELLRAEPVLRRVLADADVASLRTFDGAKDPLDLLRGGLGVGIGKKDEIIRVAFTGPHPAEAALLVNAVVAAYRDYSTEQARSTTGGALDLLREEKRRQEQALADKRGEIVTFKESNGEMFFAVSGGTNVLAQNMAAIGAKLTEARLNETRVRANFEGATNRLIAEQAWRQARAEVAEFERLYEAQKGRALEVNAKQATYERLQEEAQRLVRLCDTLDQRIKQLAVVERSGGLNVQVLEAARAEEKPSSPNRRAIALASGMLGLLLGCGLAATREWLDQRLRTPEEAARQLGLAVLGIIPHVPPERERPGRAAGLRRSGGRRRLFGEAGDDPAGGPQADAAEAYRMLRTVVYFNCSSQTGQSILVTSAERFDGKSTTCANLAAAMARSGRRTLLVDADLRKPVQHETFDVPGRPGLGEVVAGTARLEEAVQRTAVEDLSVLPAGATPPNPSELVNGEAFGALLRRLATIYDFVLIDSPPLLAVSDAHVLGAQVDWTILTVRANKTTRREARLAVERLRRVGSRVLGAVFNAAPRGRHSAGAGYYDEYHNEQTTTVSVSTGDR